MSCRVLIVLLIITTGNCLKCDGVTWYILCPVAKNKVVSTRLSVGRNIKVAESLQHPYNLFKTRGDFVKLAEQKTYNFDKEYVNNILNSLPLLQISEKGPQTLATTTESISIFSTENPVIKESVKLIETTEISSSDTTKSIENTTHNKIKELTYVATTMDSSTQTTTSPSVTEKLTSDIEIMYVKTESTEHENLVETTTTSKPELQVEDYNEHFTTTELESTTVDSLALETFATNKGNDSYFETTTEQIQPPVYISGVYSTSSTIDTFITEPPPESQNLVDENHENNTTIDYANTSVTEENSNLTDDDVTTNFYERITSDISDIENNKLSTNNYVEEKYFSTTTVLDSTTESYTDATAWIPNITPLEIDYKTTSTENSADYVVAEITNTPTESSPKATTTTLSIKISPTNKSVREKFKFTEPSIESTTEKLDDVITATQIIERTAEVSKPLENLNNNVQLADFAREILGEIETSSDRFIDKAITIDSVSTSRSETELQELTTQRNSNEVATELIFHQPASKFPDSFAVSQLDAMETASEIIQTAVTSNEPNVEETTEMFIDIDRATEYYTTTENSPASKTEAISEFLMTTETTILDSIKSDNVENTKSLFTENSKNEGPNRKTKKLSYATDVMPSLGDYDLF